MAEHGWPADWDERKAGRDCPLCGALGQGDNDYSVAVHAGQLAEVRLERRTRLPGYCIVVWRHGHVAEPDDLDPGQASGYWAEAVAVGRAVRARFGPVKMNYMTLGNTVPHLHTHVVPRYLDDPAPGGPIEWAQIHSAEPVPEPELHRQAAGLRSLLSPGLPGLPGNRRRRCYLAPVRRRSSIAGSAPSTSRILVRLVAPVTSVTARRGTPNAAATAASAASVA